MNAVGYLDLLVVRPDALYGFGTVNNPDVAEQMRRGELLPEIDLAEMAENDFEYVYQAAPTIAAISGAQLPDAGEHLDVDMLLSQPDEIRFLRGTIVAVTLGTRPRLHRAVVRCRTGPTPMSRQVRKLIDDAVRDYRRTVPAPRRTRQQAAARRLVDALAVLAESDLDESDRVVFEDARAAVDKYLAPDD